MLEYNARCNKLQNAHIKFLCKLHITIRQFSAKILRDERTNAVNLLVYIASRVIFVVL